MASLSEKRQVKNVDAIVSFLLDQLGQGAGNGHFIAHELSFRYLRNGKIMTITQSEIHFDNGYYNSVTITELVSFNSPRIMDQFFSNRDIFTYDGEKLTITGGRLNSSGYGRYEIHIWKA